MSGFDCPEWGDVARGLQLGQVALEDPMLGIARRGWQRGAALHAEEQFRTVVVWPRLHPGEQALLRSQSGPLAGVPSSCVPSSAATHFSHFAPQTSLVPFALVFVKLQNGVAVQIQRPGGE